MGALTEGWDGCVLHLGSPIQRTHCLQAEPCYSLLRHGLPLYLQVRLVSGVLTQKLTWTLITLRRFQFPRTSSSASLPGLTRNSGSLQQHPDRGFLSSRSWLPPLPWGDRVSTTCPQGHTRLVCPQVTATCRPTHTSAPGSWEKRGPTPWR